MSQRPGSSSLLLALPTAVFVAALTIASGLRIEPTRLMADLEVPSGCVRINVTFQNSAGGSTSEVPYTTFSLGSSGIPIPMLSGGKSWQIDKVPPGTYTVNQLGLDPHWRQMSMTPTSVTLINSATCKIVTVVDRKWPCIDGSECPASATTCKTPSCTNHTCGFTNVSNGMLCSDDSACTLYDSCQNGTCTGSSSVTCTASDQCHTAGTCNPTTGVCSNPPKANGSSCTDGNACTLTDTCQSGSCTGGNPKVCTASDQCHAAGTCNTSTGVCTNPVRADGTGCNADNSLCTVSDYCQAGTCKVGSPVTCTALDQCHSVGTCIASTGLCTHPNKANGTTCTDGSACTQTDRCQTGVCTGTNPVICTPPDQCHAAICLPATGQCNYPAVANGTPCGGQGFGCMTGTCVDVTGPSVTITAPANGVFVRGSILVNATATDNVGVVGVNFRLNNGYLAPEDTSSPYGITWDTKTTSDGTKVLIADARDARGNVTTSPSVTVIVDNTPPAIRITAPLNEGFVKQTVTIQASATDAIGVAGVQFTLDGANLGPEDTTAPYEFAWNTTTGSNGSHMLTAIARDVAGNLATSAQVAVVVDNVPPTVSLTAPAAGSLLHGTTVTLSASASDNLAIAGVQFTLDGTNLGSEDTTAPYEFTWDTTTAGNGTRILRAIARDRSGNLTSSSQVSVTVDNAAPTVSVTAPANNASILGTTVSVTASASDNVAIAGVQFTLDGANLGSEDVTSPYAFTWDTTAVADGNYVLRAVARDTADNITTSSPVTVTVDNTNPTVSIAAPAAASFVRAAVTVTADAADNSAVGGVQFTLDGVNQGSEDTTAPYVFTWDTTKGSNGSHTISAIVRDVAGNTATSATVTVTVDNAVPTVSITTPGNNASVGGIAVTVSANAADNFGVVGVQFKVDGVNLGAEDTTVPFTIPWNTATATNFVNHTLTAVARDAAGNSTVSSPITVSVQNYGCLEVTTVLQNYLSQPYSGPAPFINYYITGAPPWGCGQNPSPAPNADVVWRRTNITGPSNPTALCTMSQVILPNGGGWRSVSVSPVGPYTVVHGPVCTQVTSIVRQTPPPLNVTLSAAPLSGQEAAGSVTLTASVSGGPAYVNVEFYDITNPSNHVKIGATLTNAPYTVPWNIAGLGNGQRTVRATATRSIPGSATETVNSALTVVVNNMSLALSAPAAGSIISGAAYPVATAVSGNIDKVEFFLDGATTPFSTDTTYPFGLAWDTTAVTNGSHTLMAKATRGSLPPVTSPTVSFTISNLAVVVTAPSANAVLNGAVPLTATVSGVTASNTAPSVVDFYLDSVKVSTVNFTSSPATVTYGSNGYSNGSYQLTARAVRGSTTFVSAPVPVTINNLSISLTQPPSGGIVSGSAVPLTATVGGIVDKVEFFHGSAQIGEDSTAPFTGTWDTTGLPNGNTTLTARATRAGLPPLTSQPITVHVSNLTTTLTAPAANAMLSGPVTMTATVGGVTIGSTNPSGVDFYIGSTKVATDTTAPYTYTWNSTTVSNGSYELKAIAVRSPFNFPSPVVPVTVSNLTVNITDPAGGATVSGTKTLTATVGGVGGTGTPPSAVDFYDGSTKIGTGTAGAGNTWTFDWNTAGLSNGTHTLTAKAIRGSDIFTSPATSVTVSNLTVSITAPAQDAMLANTVTITTSVTALDMNGVKVEFYDGSTKIGEDTSSPFSLSWDTTGVSNGSHTLTAKAVKSGLPPATSVAVGVTVDNAPPSVSITAPAGDAVLRGPSVAVTANASDNTGVSGVQFTLDGANLGSEDTSAPYGVTWDTTTASNGSHTLTAIARDAAGNATTSSSLTVIVDNAAPSVSMTAPSAGAAVSGTSLAVTADASDNRGVVGVQFKLDGANLGSEDVSSPYSITWDTTAASGGPHSLTAVARDAAGNVTTSAAITVTVDNVAPVISGVAANPVTHTTATILWTTDEDSTTQVEYGTSASYGSETTLGTSLVKNHSQQLTGLSVSTLYHYRVKSRDAAGNLRVSGDHTFTTTTPSPPVVTVTAPAQSAFLSGNSVSVTATASGDYPIAGVQFTLDGADLGNEDTTAPYGITWNTTAVGNGSHVLRAIARDAAGHSTTSSIVTVRVDNVVPTVAWTAPADGAQLGGTAVALTATASDNVGVAGVQFKIGTQDIGAEDVSAPYGVTLNTTTVGNGVHTLYVIARDAAGNTATSSISITVDNAAPSVSVTAPLNGTNVSGANVPVTATASDNVGVSSVQFTLDGANLGNEDTTAPYGITWDSTNVSAGTHTLTAVARDAAGNATTSASVSVTVTIPDTTPPSVSITVPANGALVGGSAISITASASDNIGVSGVQFKLDGTNLGAEDTSSPYGFVWDASAVSNGSHVLTAVARDAAGNSTTSNSVTVTVDNTPPVVSVTAPASNAILTGADVTVTADASDTNGVVGVQFTLDGQNLGNVDTTAPYGIPWDTTAVSNGSHTLRAIARDAAGNTTTSASVPVIVLNLTVTITAPSNGATVSETVNVNASVSPSDVVPESIEFFDGQTSIGVDTTQPFSVSWNTTTGTVPNGTHELKAKATIGSQTYWSPVVTVTVANTAAFSLTILPATSSLNTVTPVTLTLEAENTSQISPPQSVPVTLTLPSGLIPDTPIPNGGSLAGQTITWMQDIPAGETKTVSVIVRLSGPNFPQEGTVLTVNGTAGPSGAGQGTGTAQITVGQPPLTVTISAPSDGATVSGTVNITATAGGNPTSVQFQLDGQNLGAPDTAAPYAVSWNTMTVANGSYSLTAIATRGNEAPVMSTPVKVLVNNQSIYTIRIRPPTSTIHSASTVGLSVDVQSTSQTPPLPVTLQLDPQLKPVENTISDGGTWNNNNGTITWTVALGVGVPKSLTVDVMLKGAPFPAAGQVLNAVATIPAGSSNAISATSVITVSAAPGGCLEVTTVRLDSAGNTFTSGLPAFTYQTSPSAPGAPTTTGPVTRFANLPSGNYTVTQPNVPAGWKQVFISDGGQVEVRSGSSCAQVTVRNQQKPVDLSIVHVGVPATAGAGDDVAYTITVKNTSDIATGSVQIADMLPENLDFVSAPGSTQLGDNVFWKVPTIAAGQSMLFTVNARVPLDAQEGTSIYTLATASTQDASGPVYVSAPATVTVGYTPTTLGCLRIQKIVESPGFANASAGQQQFLFEVADISGNTAPFTVTTDSSGLATIRTLEPDIYVVTEKPLSGWEAVGSAEEYATVEEDSCAVVTFRNRPAGGVPTFSITKTHTPQKAIPGQEVVYSITVKNTSTIPAEGSLIVLDALPPELEYVTSDGTAIPAAFGSGEPVLSTEQQGTVGWNLPPLGPGAFAELSVKATIQPKTPVTASIRNTVMLYANKQPAGSATDVLTMTEGLGCIHIVDNSSVFGEEIAWIPPWVFQLDGKQSVKTNSKGSAYFYDVTPGDHSISEILTPTKDGPYEWENGFLDPYVTVPAGPCVEVLTFHYTEPVETSICREDNVCASWKGETCINCPMDCDECPYSSSSSESSSSPEESSSSESSESSESSDPSDPEPPDLWCSHLLTIPPPTICFEYDEEIHSIGDGTVMFGTRYAPNASTNPSGIKNPLDCASVCALSMDIGKCCVPKRGCVKMKDAQCAARNNTFFPYSGGGSCEQAYKLGRCW